jgi:hypothetical protein
MSNVIAVDRHRHGRARSGQPCLPSCDLGEGTDARHKTRRDGSEFGALEEAVHQPFAAALLDPEQAIPADVTSHTARRPEKRFALYRNNVTVGLMEAVRARFPATERIVGEAFFAAMARDFVRRHPPHSPLLMLYGDALPGFIATFPPVADLTYLADVARLEAARTAAYHAADATPLDAADFCAIDPNRLGALRGKLHPSVGIIRSKHPVVTIWAMNSGEAALGPVDLAAPEDALVARPALTVTVQALPPGAAAFLLALGDGATFAAAAARAIDDTAAFDPTATLALLIGSGLTTCLSSDPEEMP